ncbi:RidA family protein [Phytoactinopolyspora limicola]|uniref:RidA family protein n=1 Tax=Phytoactinopolyspora limicola TaxID=2715536 RepID=UPI0014076912|nr:RidA family protein [Phytoactinopolyspora limicola]
MTHEIIRPPDLATPSGFAHAVVSTGGRTVWLAGQTALDAEGSIVAAGDVVTQMDQALGNLLTALDAAGGRPEHLVSMTIYIVDVEDYQSRAREIGAVWRRRIGAHYPAMAGIGVARLWDADALVEVAGVAVIN